MGIPETNTVTETETFLSERRTDEILDCFCSGTAGGFGYFFLKGVDEFPKGSPIGKLLDNGCLAARIGAPQFAGYSILISTMFSTVDSTMDYICKKDDVFNKLTAGAACTGLLKIPHRLCGLGTPVRSIVLGGSLTGLFLSNLYHYYYIAPKACSPRLELETSPLK